MPLNALMHSFIAAEAAELAKAVISTAKLHGYLYLLAF